MLATLRVRAASNNRVAFDVRITNESCFTMALSFVFDGHTIGIIAARIIHTWIDTVTI